MQYQQSNSEDDYPHPFPVICPYCCIPNARQQDFCRSCATPLTAYATIAPLAQVYCQGDAYRKSVSNPYKPIVLIGIWLLFGPMGVGVTYLAIVSLVTPFKKPVQGTSELIAILFSLLFYGSAAFIFDTILYRTTQNFFRIRHQSDDTDEPQEDLADDDTPEKVDHVAEQR